MEQRMSLITLGVKDLSRSRGFYNKLGWKEVDGISDEYIAFYQMSGFMMALYPLNLLLEAQNKKASGPGSITLAINVRSKEEVDNLIKEFASAGGSITAEPKEYPWAYSSYVADLDGHSWEISYVPSLLPDEKGELWAEKNK